MFVVEQLHDELGGLEEIVLFFLGNPKLRLNLRHTFGQFLISIGFSGIEQMPKRNMADFAAALPEIVHQEPAPRLPVLLLDRNAHSLEQGTARFDQHGIRGIERIVVDEIVDEGAAGLLRVELSMIAQWRGVDDDNDTSLGKQPIERRA